MKCCIEICSIFYFALKHRKVYSHWNLHWFCY